MDEQFQKDLAAQLRQPFGDMGLEVAAHMNKGNAPMNRFGIRHLNLEAGDHILEIGMGNGFFVREMLDVHDSINYTGCDFSEAMVKEAEKLNREFLDKKRATFIHTTADKLPLEDNQFNKVFAANTIYFWSDPVSELAELRRVTRENGKTVSYTHLTLPTICSV